MRQNICRPVLILSCALFLVTHFAGAQTLGLPNRDRTGGDASSTNSAAPDSTTNQVDKILTNTPASALPSRVVPTVPAAWNHDAPPATFQLPPSVPDPLEPMNRVLWSFNKGILIGVVQPSGRVYRFIVRKPIRTGIANFGRNITYPGRLLNNLLQGKWAGARHETDRFFCNTVIGAAGFVDVASKWKMPKSDADFGQTFGHWGWQPHLYLMLPLFGPSNERDGLGLIGDYLASPINYFSPYSYATYGIFYNKLTESVDDYVRFARAERDAYADLQYAWTFVRQNRVADFQVKGEQDEPSIESLQSVFFTYQNPEFPGKSKTRSALIPATGKKLKFTFWLQPGKAPVVYIIPGLGSHRLAESSSALAELVYQKGFSAVCVSSAYNPEFMEHASTAAMPAFTPVDARDLHVALTEINHRLETLYPDRLGAKALMGYSMGAFQSLFIAAGQWTNVTPLIKFDRYVAINTPVRLLYGISKLDEFYRAPLEWPAEKQTAEIENTFLKVAALSSTSLRPRTTLPFSAIESRFLIGLTFRFVLRDIIYSSQRRNNQGVLEQPIKSMRRAPLYEEILEYSYKDYVEKFVVEYYKTRGFDLTDPEMLTKAGDLRFYSASLKASRNIRLVSNRNDFLLADEDFDWLQATFPPEQLTIFEKGGHLGNLSHAAVQKAILKGLEDLTPVRPKSE